MFFERCLEETEVGERSKSSLDFIVLLNYLSFTGCRDRDILKTWQLVSSVFSILESGFGLELPA